MPILETCEFIWSDEDATAAFAARLAQDTQLGNAVIELHGGLGAGKTTLARLILRALGVTGTIKSPSYSVMESYELPAMVIAHFDFYRFNDPQEWEDAGFRDVFADNGLKLVEWPAKADGLLPVPDLCILIDAPDESHPSMRHAQLQAHTQRGKALLEKVRA